MDLIILESVKANIVKNKNKRDDIEIWTDFDFEQLNMPPFELIYSKDKKQKIGWISKDNNGLYDVLKYEDQTKWLTLPRYILLKDGSKKKIRYIRPDDAYDIYSKFNIELFPITIFHKENVRKYINNKLTDTTEYIKSIIFVNEQCLSNTVNTLFPKNYLRINTNYKCSYQILTEKRKLLPKKDKNGIVISI